MRKILFILAISAVITGCCSMGQQAVWKDGQHFLFSAYGYKKATPVDVYKTASGGWWGCEVMVK
jgi:hypothetical protein